jgi:hypothetical protein
LASTTSANAFTSLLMTRSAASASKVLQSPAHESARRSQGGLLVPPEVMNSEGVVRSGRSGHHREKESHPSGRRYGGGCKADRPKVEIAERIDQGANPNAKIEACRPV